VVAEGVVMLHVILPLAGNDDRVLIERHFDFILTHAGKFHLYQKGVRSFMSIYGRPPLRGRLEEAVVLSLA